MNRPSYAELETALATGFQHIDKLEGTGVAEVVIKMFAVTRDGQEIETSVGVELCELDDGTWEFEEILFKKVVDGTLKERKTL